MTRQAPALLLLGPQTHAPVLREALLRAGMQGPWCSISAGWQEREAELGALEEHLGAPVEDLRLYARTEAVFAADPELQVAYRSRQAALRELQDLYRIRLEHAKNAVRELWPAAIGSRLGRQALREALAALRRLDREHLRSIADLHAAFNLQWRPLSRPALRAQVEDVVATLARAGTLLMPGGHVAVLLNRLRLFEAGRWLQGAPIAAWSAGAMALTERIVLFHDHPPQGKGNAEVFEAGLGLLRGTVLLPHARLRLALEDRERVELMARRFAPQRCYALDAGSWLLMRDEVLLATAATQRLDANGRVRPLALAA